MSRRPAHTPPAGPLVSTAEAARMLGLTPKALHERARLARRGTPRASSLPSPIKVGARAMYRRAEIEAVIGLAHAHEQATEPAPSLH